MTKRTAAKYKIDRRMGENIWGPSKIPPSTVVNTAPASTVSAVRENCRTSALSCAPSKS